MAVSNVKKLNKKKMSGSSIAAIIVSALILLGLLLSILSSNGVFLRAKKGAESENFEINGSMMSYYTNAYYQNWLNQNYYYIYLGYIKFDPNASLKDQYVDEKKTETYFDMFSKAASDMAARILKYCEAAKADSTVNFAEIEAEAKADAKSFIESIEKTAKSNGYTVSAYIRMNYGENAKKNDVYRAAVLQNIASAYSEIMYDRFYDAITDEDKEGYFSKNLSTFVSAKYLTYAISSSVAMPTVKPEDYEGGKESQEYKDALAAAEAKVKEANEAQKLKDREFLDKLAAAKSEDEFKNILLDYLYENNAFKAAYDAAVKDFKDAEKPSDADLNAFKTEIKDKVIAAVLEGKTDIYEEEEEKEEDAEDESEEEEVIAPWEKVKKELPASVIKSLTSSLTSAEKAPSYSLSNDVNKWLFGGVKAQFGIEYTEEEDKNGTSAKLGETKIVDEIADEKTGKYTLTVYYVTKEAGRDETLLRDVGHILFEVGEKATYKTMEEAKAKAEEIHAELLKKADANGLVSKEDFEEIGLKNTGDSSVFYENVGKGQMVEEFENWLFEQTEVGKMGFVETQYGMHLMYFVGETETPAWSFTAHESVAGEKLDEWFEKLPYNVEINAKVFDSILK